MARNRKYQSAAIRFGPALKAFLLCLLIGGSGVGYVWQKDQISQLGQQIKKRELQLAELGNQNEKLRKQLADDAIARASWKGAFRNWAWGWCRRSRRRCGG